MPFEVRYPTRHTDAFAGTGFVHAGVLLALTEMAYQAFETHCGLSKPAHVYAVQRATEAVYAAPLRWGEAAVIRVRTLAASARGFDQEFQISGESDGREVARFLHHWVWLDSQSGKTQKLDEATCAALLAGGD